jgi:hypothetical protein
MWMLDTAMVESSIVTEQIGKGHVSLTFPAPRAQSLMTDCNVCRWLADH